MWLRSRRFLDVIRRARRLKRQRATSRKQSRCIGRVSLCTESEFRRKDRLFSGESAFPFRYPRRDGSHLVLIHPETRTRTVVPGHAGRTLKEPLLRAIIRDANLTVDAFRKLLQTRDPRLRHLREDRVAQCARAVRERFFLDAHGAHDAEVHVGHAHFAVLVLPVVPVLQAQIGTAGD
jgi:predicted RNA binding protein YcfA (HicA-like mRNA interferase family)